MRRNMKKEIEVKVLNIDPVKLRKNLKKMGAVQQIEKEALRKITPILRERLRDYESYRLGG